MTIEAWRPVPAFPGYEASDLGRVRTLRKGAPRVMRPEVDKDGYMRLKFVRDGVYHRVLVSRVVCETFNGPATAPLCCHDDNDKANNRPGNLRWDTQRGNCADKLRHGTHQAGSRHPCATIDEATAVCVKALRAAGMRSTWVAPMLGVSLHVVNDISSGKTWRHA